MSRTARTPPTTALFAATARPLAVAAILVAAACYDATGPQSDFTLAAAFSSMLLGFDNVESSFAGGAAAWLPDGGARGMGGPAGMRGEAASGMCGGGLGGAFLGGVGFGHRFASPARFANCPFDAVSGRVVCEPAERNGLTIERSAGFADANGNVQQAYDDVTTDAMNARIAVSGTITRRNGATNEVEHASDRTVTGLAEGSTERTVNGTSAGRETTTGTTERGAFTAARVMGDTITDVVVSLAEGAPSYPISGTVVRSMQVTLELEGEAPLTAARREVVTYDGSDTATVVITRNGETRTCSLPLPRGRLECS